MLFHHHNHWKHSKEPVIRMIYIAKAMNPLYIHTICLGRTSKFRKEALRFFHFIGNFLDIFKKVIDK